MNREEILDSYFIVTALDENYVNIFELWMHYFERLNYTKCLRVITYDKKSDRYIREKGIISIPVREKIRSPRDIYVTRLNAILQLLKSGKNVIHTDSDAFWLKDPLPLTVKKKFDLQISIGHGIPKKAITEWGFSLCCGFFIFHSNAPTLKFFETWISKSIEMNHDQNALNELFLANSTEWKLNDLCYNTGSCPEFNISIEAIDDSIISRKNKNGIFVFHPYLSSKYAHLKLLKAIKLLKEIDDSGFIQMNYYRNLFNLSKWIYVSFEVIHKAIGKLARTK
jgi:hypothetical protein